MQYCPKCRIYIRGRKKCCPLCQGRLEDDNKAEDSPFPVLPVPHVSGYSFLKIATFAAVVLIVLMGFIDYVLHGRSAVPKLVSLCAVLAVGDLHVGAYFRNNIMKMVVVQEYIVALITIAADRLTGGFGWSFAWTVPCLLTASAATIVIIGKAMHRTFETYAIYILWAVIFSLLQIIPIKKGWNPMPLPAVINMCLMFVFAAGIVIFKGREMRNAGKKWFNF